MHVPILEVPEPVSRAGTDQRLTEIQSTSLEVAGGQGSTTAVHSRNQQGHGQAARWCTNRRCESMTFLLRRALPPNRSTCRSSDTAVRYATKNTDAAVGKAWDP